MCWNASVSFNTFLFSSFILVLIIYNNYFTQYKIQELNNIWIYLFLASFIFMQLIEFFIWKNINNPFLNHVFSTMGTFLIFIQPIFSIMIIKNIQIRNILLILYLLLAIPFSIYKYLSKHIHSVVSESGHLRWKFFEITPFILLIWLFFLLFGLIYEQKWVGFGFGLILVCVSYYNYKNDHTMGSMWCWLINSIMFYYAFYLLFYLPFILVKN